MWVKQVPSRGSMLYALEVPRDAQGETLGDTSFASTSAAYDALPEALRERIEGRRAVFSAQQYIEFRIAQTPVDPATGEVPPEVREGMRERAKNMVPEISHPLVKRHPRTGRKCIYFSEGAIHHIEGLGVEESQQILRELQAHLLQPRFVYRHRWREGDVVMWDNIACLHKAFSDYQWPQRRRMHRTTLAHNPKPEFA